MRQNALVRLTLLACLTALAACYPVANYPARDDERAISNDPNTSPMPAVTMYALRTATNRFPVDGAFVINLPEGQTLDQARWILRTLGDADARLASNETARLPAYHVTRIWVRGSDAHVTVLCPVWDDEMSHDTPGFEREHRTVFMKMEGVGERWTVQTVRSWPARVMETPPLFGWE